MIEFDVKGTDPKYTRKIKGIYRAPNKIVLAIEKSASPNFLRRKLTKRNIISGDLN